jgi:hypothetical protein
MSSPLFALVGRKEVTWPDLCSGEEEATYRPSNPQALAAQLALMLQMIMPWQYNLHHILIILIIVMEMPR